METKKIFWKLVNALEGVSDTIVKNEQGVVIERGMMLSNDYSVMYVIDEGFIKICNSDNESLLEFDEDSLLLEALSELFEDVYLNEQAKEKLISDMTATIEITNLDKLNTLLNETIDKLNQIKNFKFDVKTTLDGEKEAAPEVPTQKQKFIPSKPEN